MSDSKWALFLGLNTIDLQFHVNGYPSANSKIKAHRNSIGIGGPATNAAITAAFLGLKAKLVSPVGNNPLSPYILDELKSYGVDLVDPIEKVPSAPVFASIISDDLNGDRTIFSYLPPENDLNYSIPSLSGMKTFNIALFDGFYPLLAQNVLKQLKDNGVPVVFDCGSWKPGLEKVLKYADIAICSNDFVFPECNSKAEIFQMFEKYGIQKIAITRGAGTILYSEGKEIQEVAVKKIQAKDTSGAGDIFHGAFCYFYLVHADFRLALEKASEVAGFSCKYHGTRSWMEYFENHQKQILKTV